MAASSKHNRGPRAVFEWLENRRLLTSDFLQYALVSDQANQALIQDPNLVSPWGIGLNPASGNFWISDNATGVATSYGGDVNGSPLLRSPVVVAIPGGSPTGQVANTTTTPQGATTGFTISSAGSSAPADYLFAGDTGEISGWNTDEPPPSPSTAAQLAASAAGANFTGLAIGANTQQGPLLYAADFHNNKIDAFNSSFQLVTLTGSFSDPNIPAGFAPFNIQNLDGQLYVTYAKQDSTREHAVAGPGDGFVDVYDMNGNLTNRLIVGNPGASTSPLNAPWGVALAPASFGSFGGDLLVANSGDGHINAFQTASGTYMGALLDPSGNPIGISGLHAIAVGNDLTAGNSNLLFFTAGTSNGSHGFFGALGSIDTSSFGAVGTGLAAGVGTPFSGTVATFSDTHPGAFSATIQWGDGSSSTGSVTSLGNNQFLVSGSHTYAATGAFTLSVSVTDSTGSTTVATSTATVGSASSGLAVSGVPFTAIKGTAFSGQVATFTDGDGNTSATAYTATINWGDGAVTAGTVATAGSGFSVSGGHIYATAKQFTVTVTVDDSDGARATGTATATVSGVLSATGTTLAATEATTFSGAVATFTDSDGNASTGVYSAAIDWGDGTTTAGVISATGGGFQVSGVHKYLDEGTMPVAVVIRDSDGSTATATSTATVSEHDTLTGQVVLSGLTEGASRTVSVATFTDTDTGNLAKDFIATIDWGDGTTDAGTVNGVAGNFSVTGTHAYAEEGVYSVRVIVADDGAGTASATLSGSTTVADARLTVTRTVAAMTEGVAFSGSVATLSDANTSAAVGDFTATIDWGDGETSAGTVSANGSGSFNIAGNHTYSEGGTYAIGVSVVDAGGSSASATQSAAVADYPLAGSGVNVSGTEGGSFSGTVATFDDTDPDGGSVSEYSVTIDWGDGNHSAGSVSGSAGHYTVDGTHTFADESSRILVMVRDAGGATATVRSLATIADSDVLTGSGGTVSGTEGQAFSGVLASFTNANTANSAGDFLASIDWGDGTTSTGTVSGTTAVYTVSGKHTYADEGSYTAHVVLRDDPPGTAAATASVAVHVADAPLTPNAFTFHPTEGSTFTGAVASFTDGNAAAPASDFTATIDWGNGSTTAGTATAAGGGVFNVVGAHTFPEEEGDTAHVSVTVHDVGGSSATADSTAVVADAPLSVSAVAFTTMEQSAPTSVMVATFTDTGPLDALSEYSAAIDWGDGTSSTATLTLSGSTFTVAGSHTYGDEGHFTIAVTARESGGGSGTGQAAATVLEELLSDGTRGTAVERWVNEVFHDLLGRQADPGGLVFWSGLEGSIGRQQVVADIQNSTEYRSDQVEAVYGTYLHRPADPSGLSYFVSFLQAGNTVEQMETVLASSPEFFAVEGGGTNDGFLDVLYHDALGRAVDPAGRQFFDQALAAGATRGEVAAAIFSSDEYLSDVVSGIYENLLQRPPDTDGLAFWVAALKAGAHDEQIVAGIAASDEYFSKTAA
ncbi:MAG TPA: TIGR03118 family protein [Pirellulales bacterium]|nr:TIGR03118 family protein [Pirellulales bacterium]